jgi:hypothetical protein
MGFDGVPEIGPGGISIHGKGTFDFSKVTIPQMKGFPVSAENLSGNAFFRGDSAYFKESIGTILSSTFNFEGTLTGGKNLSDPSIDLEASSHNLSPIISNLLINKFKNGNYVRIRIRGRLSSPRIQVMER